jgi:hypothetical protein
VLAVGDIRVAITLLLLRSALFQMDVPAPDLLRPFELRLRRERSLAGSRRVVVEGLLIVEPHEVPHTLQLLLGRGPLASAPCDECSLADRKLFGEIARPPAVPDQLVGQSLPFRHAGEPRARNRRPHRRAGLNQMLDNDPAADFITPRTAARIGGIKFPAVRSSWRRPARLHLP